MVVGMIGYVGSRLPLVYTNPLGSQTADTYLNDFSSYSYSAVFDSNNDLYVADLDRSRVLVYRHPLTIGGSPVVNLSPASLTFPGQLVGTQSNPRPVTLTNTGNRTLIITNIATSGDFSQTNTCGTSVAAGANCVVNVIFAPTKKGARTGALTITDNATGSPHSVSLTGTGAVNPVPVSTSLAPSSANAGDPQFTLTVNGSKFLSSSVVQWNGSALATTLVNAQQLTATVPASDVANAGTAAITVSNPPPGGGISNNLTFTINNLAPTVISLSPDNRIAGGTDFTLTVSGTNFVNTSTVQWNGAARVTTFVNSTTLTAAITAADIANAGNASVTVTNSSPGGGTSNPVNFTINNAVPTEMSLSLSTKTACSRTLTVAGTNFVSTSVVQWNGLTRLTTFVSSTTLTAAITPPISPMAE